MFFEDLFENGSQFLPVFGGHIGIHFVAHFLFIASHWVFKGFIVNIEDRFPKHLNQPSI